MKTSFKNSFVHCIDKFDIMNHKILMYTIVTLIEANLLFGLFTNFWANSNYPNYIYSILILLLIIFVTKAFSKKK